MRTTLDIDDDVLQAAKEIALTQGSTAGKVFSELARKGLSDRSVTMDLVNELRDEER